MSLTPHDIKDDEIRVISSGNNDDGNPYNRPTTKRKWIVTVSILVVLACVMTVVYLIFAKNSKEDSLEIITNETVVYQENTEDIVPDTIISEPLSVGFISVSDTIINRIPLTIFNPTTLTPTLQIGTDVINDSTVRFVVQAADVRGDNGGTVGAYDNKGELISKGQAKSGFCAIIGGKINIGVADATPFLEQALETDGYFFRQYPLVVANQVVENKPKGKSLRKALAELNGETVVIMSRKEMTFHDFSQSLVDLGVANAIYLVGGKGYGFAIDSEGRKIEFGRLLKDMRPNTNYIVWR